MDLWNKLQTTIITAYLSLSDVYFLPPLCTFTLHSHLHLASISNPSQRKTISFFFRNGSNSFVFFHMCTRFCHFMHAAITFFINGYRIRMPNSPIKFNRIKLKWKKKIIRKMPIFINLLQKYVRTENEHTVNGEQFFFLNIKCMNNKNTIK